MAVSAQDFQFVADIVAHDAGIVLEEKKAYLVDARLSKLAREEGVATPTDVIAKLRKTPTSDLRRKIIDAMTTNETFFFRDTGLFDGLRTSIMPKLLAQRAKTKTLTVWCAACSTGQEPYSIAMTLHKNFAELSGWRVKIIASDISQTVLKTARSGIYNQIDVNRGLPKDMLDRYFAQQGQQWLVKDDLKKWIEFRQVNLKEPFSGVSGIDMIFVRNVLYYFSQDTKVDILNRMAKLLPTDGLLFLGGTESVTGVTDALERVQFGTAIAYVTKQIAKKAGGSP